MNELPIAEPADTRKPPGWGVLNISPESSDCLPAYSCAGHRAAWSIRSHAQATPELWRYRNRGRERSLPLWPGRESLAAGIGQASVALNERVGYVPVYEEIAAKIPALPGRVFASFRFLPFYRDAFRVTLVQLKEFHSQQFAEFFIKFSVDRRPSRRRLSRFFKVQIDIVITDLSKGCGNPLMPLVNSQR